MTLPEFPLRAYPESGLARRVSRVFPASPQIRAGMRALPALLWSGAGFYAVGSLGSG